MTDYDDDYPTCKRTFATFRVYPQDLDPSEVTERLGIAPSTWQRKGESIVRLGRRPQIAPIHGWFLTSEGQVNSRDLRRHIDWILGRVEPSAGAIRGLLAAGCVVDVSCYWLARWGHDGPILSATQMRRLGEMGVELMFDFYGPYDEGDGE